MEIEKYVLMDLHSRCVWARFFFAVSFRLLAAGEKCVNLDLIQFSCFIDKKLSPQQKNVMAFIIVRFQRQNRNSINIDKFAPEKSNEFAVPAEGNFQAEKRGRNCSLQWLVRKRGSNSSLCCWYVDTTFHDKSPFHDKASKPLNQYPSALFSVCRSRFMLFHAT
jgi:hypothetical protein